MPYSADISPVLPTYPRADLSFVRGQGAWLEGSDGRSYLDFGSGVAVNALGHGHPHLVQALTEQAQKVWHVSNLFRIPEGERLAQRLIENTFAESVFFCNSGAEAIEACLKMARKYHFAQGHPERYRLITFEGAFHGRTLGALSATGNSKFLEGFGPKVDGFDQCVREHLESVEAAIGPHTAGILIEPIMGEGGVHVMSSAFLKALRGLCDRYGLLLIFDEIQTGVGRTGTFCAHHHKGVTPDIMALAKGIGGGFPLGACLATAQAAKGMTLGSHGSTFGGNPLAMACAHAVLDIVLAPGFMEEVGRKGLLLRQKLAQLQDTFQDVIEEVRGEALMLGLKLRPSHMEFSKYAREAGLLLIPAGDNVVRILPPLIVTEQDIEEGMDRLSAVCRRFPATLHPSKNRKEKDGS